MVKKKLYRSPKGFTLVEIIVVLVILAVLASVAVPAASGYINKANQQKAWREARDVFTTVQTFASEAYARKSDEIYVFKTSDSEDKSRLESFLGTKISTTTEIFAATDGESGSKLTTFQYDNGLIKIELSGGELKEVDELTN